MNTDSLKRTIGLVSATSIGLGAMLGAGIFVFPGLAGGQAGFGAIISFLIGGIIALAVAACTAELATAMPRSGGGYFFASRTFGNFTGTVTGIAQWIGLVFACAFYLASFGEYALTILEELNIKWNLSAKIFSFSFTLLLLAINILGTKKVGRLQNIMVISLTVILILIFTYGLIDYLGIEGNSTAFSENTPNGIQSIFSTTALIFTAYLGFVQIANIGAEIKDPNKNLPRSLIWSVFIAMGLYAFIMLVCTISFPQEELQEFRETATIEVARKMLGNWGAVIVLFGGLLAALSSANASVISASRSVYAISKDKLISSKASRINKRFGTPHIALILVTIPIVFILIRSRIEVFAEVASFLHLIIYAGICLSVLKLRSNNPIWYAPTFRVPVLKVVAGFGAFSCITLLFFMQVMSILIGLGVLLAAVAYYFLFVRRNNIQLSDPNPPHIDTRIINPDVLVPIDISKEKIDLSSSVLKAIPISSLLLLGYKETPEQTESEQSEEEYSKEGEEKLEDISNKMKESNFDFDSKLIFSNKIISQIEQVIEEEEFQIILALKPHTGLNKVILPIHDLSQISARLSTLVHHICSEAQLKVQVFLCAQATDKSSIQAELRQEIEKQFSFINIDRKNYDVLEKNDLTPKKFLQESTNKNDLVILSESEHYNRRDFSSLILDRESDDILSTVIMVLRKNRASGS